MDKTGTPSDESGFDPATAQALQAAAARKLQTLLRAKQEANKASSSREFAVRCVRGLEATIHQLFDVGASTHDVLSQLIDALPSIPIDDLRYALKTIGRRNKRFNVSSGPTVPSASTGPESVSQEKIQPQTASRAPKDAKAKSPSGTAAPAAKSAMTSADLPVWADGSDKRADESDEDYRFRKEIEGPPEARRKFIGEHDT